MALAAGDGGIDEQEMRLVRIERCLAGQLQCAYPARGWVITSKARRVWQVSEELTKATFPDS
ncbi:hypothetical protein [Streptomyces longisporoflavus]|uniref:hypothetical protein n=1 Tax=Streptomyces longisporoflavus TaxID=28044 RepID=UPI00167E2B64